MNRRDARRHRGQARMKPRPKYNGPSEWQQSGIDYRRQEIMPNDATRDALAYWTTNSNGPSFVYFIQAVDGGPVKIGRAQNPIARLSELQCGNPAQLVIVALILGWEDTEKLLHRTWGPVSHVRGEWFGGGYEHAIIAIAEETSRRQIAERQNGWSEFYVAGSLVWSILNDREGQAA